MKFSVGKMEAATVTPSDLTRDEIDIIRHNWSVLGYIHHLNDLGTETWRNATTGHTVSFYEWV